MTFNIGFDFGTSTTKVTYYNLLDEKHYLFVFDPTQKNHLRYCVNSLIRVFNGQFFFSHAGGGQNFRLFKLRATEKNIRINTADTEVLIPGYYLIAIYCAFVLSKVRKKLQEKFPGANLIFHFGIPVDHLSNAEDNLKREYFERAFGVAEILSRRNLVDNFTNVSDILNLMPKVEKEFISTRTKERKVSIYPETLAGIATLLMNYTLEHTKRYSIMDIGAGTTDFSFFEFSDSIDPDGKFYVYSSKTLTVGAENYVNDNLTDSMKKISDNYRLGFGESYFKCQEKWDTAFRIIYLGGGSRGELINSLNDVELRVRREQGTHDFINPEKISLPIPDKLYDGEDDSEKCWKDYFDFLGISYGLSFPHVYMPKYNPEVPNRQREVLRSMTDEPLTPDVG